MPAEDGSPKLTVQIMLHCFERGGLLPPNQQESRLGDRDMNGGSRESPCHLLLGAARTECAGAKPGCRLCECAEGKQKA